MKDRGGQTIEAAVQICFLIYKMIYRGLFFYKSYLKFEFLNRNK